MLKLAELRRKVLAGLLLFLSLVACSGTDAIYR